MMTITVNRPCLLEADFALALPYTTFHQIIEERIPLNDQIDRYSQDSAVILNSPDIQLHRAFGTILIQKTLMEAHWSQIKCALL